jgi:hypothetical protein
VLLDIAVDLIIIIPSSHAVDLRTSNGQRVISVCGCGEQRSSNINFISELGIN